MKKNLLFHEKTPNKNHQNDTINVPAPPHIYSFYFC